jgi:hypothetical protein
MDAILAKIDPVIDRMEKSLEKIELYQNKKAKLPGAELDLLKQLEDARDLMNDCMKKTANDRTQLEAVFGGDCMRIRRIRAALECLDERPLSDMNKNDQRLKGAHNACDSVIKVLEDMGYGWLLRSRVTYGDDSGEPFKGNAFTVGTPIKPIRPLTGEFNKFTLDKPLPAGLTLDENTGQISGTPTAETPTTEYSVMCMGSGKPVECKLSLTVLPKPVAPPVIEYVPPQQSYKQGKDIAKWSPKLVSGEPATEYSILPALPAGINFDKATGDITGKAEALSDLSPYTVTAKNAGGANHCKIALEVLPDHATNDLVEKIIACETVEEVMEFEAIVMEEKKDKKPFNWMIWMVHRAHLNDPTLKKFDFTNLKMPSGLEEPLISPKLAVAIASNDQIEELLLPSTNLQNHEAAVFAVSLRQNKKVRVLNIDSNTLRPLELESLCHGIANQETPTLQEFRCNNVASGRQVFEAVAEMVKKNEFVCKVGLEVKEAHFRGVVDKQITKNNDAARKRRVAAKKAAEAAAAAS